jgi:hypothetical protein
LWGAEFGQFEKYMYIIENWRVLKCVSGENWRTISTEHLENEKVCV